MPMPYWKYRPYPTVDLPNRTWPDRVIDRAPIWCSTDLRDGNQALVKPMDSVRKLRMFELLVRLGVKEIEAGFPSASKTDFDFIRKLIDEDRIPADTTVAVLTQARPELIERTFEAIEGAPRAIVHLYNSTSATQRRVVFRLDEDGIVELAVRATELVKELAGGDITFEYSPESFHGTELEFALRICEAVMATWEPTPVSKMIVNLPTTVEAFPPNVYADRIEWFQRHVSARDSIVLSVHPHNDRGTAVATAELGLMAGADRVEGTLFGNGERTGNVDLVTLALNLYTQGVHPGLDFSDIDAVRQLVEECNQLPVHPRHPYAGDLVFTAFSGSHQDAIKKGFAQQKPDAMWEVPYLPIDPADLGRSYDAVIRVNSQSGKGGMAYLLEQEYGLALPRRLQIEFSRAVQKMADASGREIAAADIYTLFSSEYLEHQAPYHYISHRMTEHGGNAPVELSVALSRDQAAQALQGSGNGPIDAFVNALGVDIRLMDYHEHSIGSGANARAACYVELRVAGGASLYGVGIDSNIVTASFKAVLSAVNRHFASNAGTDQALAA